MQYYCPPLSLTGIDSPLGPSPHWVRILACGSRQAVILSDLCIYVDVWISLTLLWLLTPTHLALFSPQTVPCRILNVISHCLNTTFYPSSLLVIYSHNCCSWSLHFLLVSHPWPHFLPFQLTWSGISPHCTAPSEHNLEFCVSVSTFTSTLKPLLSLSFRMLGKAQTRIKPNYASSSNSPRLLTLLEKVIRLYRRVSNLSFALRPLDYSLEKSGCGSSANMVLVTCT